MTPIRPFRTDGCTALSWVWRKVYGRNPPFEWACRTHDREYWSGGDGNRRFESDWRLGLRVGKHTNAVFGFVVFCAVRLVGHPWLPTPWRWGYGWRWPKSRP